VRSFKILFVEAKKAKKAKSCPCFGKLFYTELFLTFQHFPILGAGFGFSGYFWLSHSYSLSLSFFLFL